MKAYVIWAYWNPCCDDGGQILDVFDYRPSKEEIDKINIYEFSGEKYPCVDILEFEVRTKNNTNS